MAVSSSLNRRYAEMPGSTGGLANRPTKAAGGVRSRFEHPSAFRERMDAGRAANASPAMPGGVQPPMMSRQDNILQSRMDGSFDAKRNAFNAAAKGQTMDEAGNIMPSSADQPAVTPPAQFASAPDGMGGNKMVRLPTPASQSGQSGQSGPPAGGTPATAPAPGVRPPIVMGPNMGPPRPRRDLAAEEKAKNPGLGDRLRKRIASGDVPPVTPPVTRNVTNNTPSRVTPPTPSRPGGMMGIAGQIAQGMQTAMQTTNPIAVPPRAAAINQTMQQRSATPKPNQGMPAGPLFAGNTAKAAIEYGRPHTIKGPRPISNAGLGVQPPQKFNSRAILAGS